MKQDFLWDIFCQVIDNHGDLGVCWRLATQLAQTQQRVRLWVDDASALHWMAPEAHRHNPNIQIYPWPRMAMPNLPMADVWIEAFSCNIPTEFIASFYSNTPSSAAERDRPIWINLEYLSAEPYVERCHQLPSPVMSGPAFGAIKYFFYPGFTHHTGGLLREHDLGAQQASFNRAQWLNTYKIPWQDERLISLFCYEPSVLGHWLTHLAADAAAVSRVLVTHGRPKIAVEQALAQLHQHPTGWGHLKLHYLPPLSQIDYDRLLWSCDVNLVRGEDSLVRAIWAGKPFVWHIYPQDDGAHWDKLYAFLEKIGMPPAWKAFHTVWNSQHATDQPLSWMPSDPQLTSCFSQIRHHLWAQTDLCEQLQQFVAVQKAHQRQEQAYKSIKK